MRDNRCRRFGEILETKDYSIFTKLKGNRKVNEVHVARLMASYSQMQLIVPIIVNEKMQVIDGQHRLEASRRLDMPVYYIGFEGYGLDECHILNANNAKYKPEDFLTGYCELGYPEYKKFQEFKNKYPFLSMHLCDIYLSGGMRKDIKGNKHKFKLGEFEINDWDKACLWAERTFDFQFYAEKFFGNRNFNTALLKMYKHDNYNHQKMMQKLSYQGGQLKHQAKEKFFIDNLCEIYNVRSKEEDKIYTHEVTKG